MKGLTVDRCTLSISDFRRLLSLRRTSRASILKTYWLEKREEKKSAVIFPRYMIFHEAVLFLLLLLASQHQIIYIYIYIYIFFFILKCNKHANLAACVLCEELSVF